MKHLVLAGGVALNCVANGRLLREGPFDDLWIQPAAGDAGGALGAALFVWHQLLERPRAPDGRRQPAGQLPRALAISTDEIARFLARQGAQGQRFASESELLEHVAGAAGRRQGRGLVPGPDGVRPAGPGRPEHPGRPPLAGDAGDDEPQDQVPRELPPVRPGRAAGARRRVVRPRARSGEPVHAAGRPGARGPPRSPIDAEAAADDAGRSRPPPPGQRRALGDPGGDPRRLQRPAPDGGRGAQPAVRTACSRRSSA